jgi:putative phosphoribosyl transferase
MQFRDRTDAGRKLAKKLMGYAGRNDVVLFALPRGGIVLGGEVANALSLPLDVIVTRKIGSPSNDEYAIGALAETGETIWNEAERKAANPAVLTEIVEREKKEAARRIKAYRHGRPLPDLSGKTAVLIDDGVATGLTIRAAIAAARHNHAKEIIIAVPHGASDSIAQLRKEGDRVICLSEPKWYGSVGQFYEDFPQTSDAEVVALLKTYAKK